MIGSAEKLYTISYPSCIRIHLEHIPIYIYHHFCLLFIFISKPQILIFAVMENVPREQRENYYWHLINWLNGFSWNKTLIVDFAIYFHLHWGITHNWSLLPNFFNSSIILLNPLCTSPDFFSSLTPFLIYSILVVLTSFSSRILFWSYMKMFSVFSYAYI